MVKIKVCGITNKKDAQIAVSLGAWALGFVFYKESPRYISPEKARKIIESLPAFITPVGVFVNEREEVVERAADICGFQTIQLHGDEDPEFCRKLQNYNVIKAFRVGSDFNFKITARYQANTILFDTYQKNVYGGTGKVFNWSKIARKKVSKPIILSGGLNSSNVAKAIKLIKPYAIDVSSGVEKSPGKKDERLLKKFFNVVKKCK